MAAQPTALRTRVFYGLGSVAYGVKDNGFAFFLLLYYNQVLGLPQHWVGLGIMIALVVDAISDPIVGYVSDNLRSRWGRRHPFMYAAALPVAGCYFLLWNPPAGLSPEVLFAYFVVIACLVRTLITFYEIPSSALVAELTDDYDERTRILSFRYFFGWWGGLTMAVLAYRVFLQPDATHSVGVLNPAGYHRYGIAASVIMAAAILVSALGTHAQIPHLRQPPPHRPMGFRRTLAELHETLSNPSFLRLFGAGIFSAMAAGLSAALNLYFATFFWELTSDQISILALGNFVSAVIAFGVAARIAGRFGKKLAVIGVACSALVLGPGPIVLRLLDAFPANGSPALLPILFVFNTTVVALVITSGILVASMIADVVEDSEVSTGRRSEGVFFAANSFVQKTVSGVGVFTSTLLLSAIGFPRDATPGEVDPQVIRNLGLVYTPLLVALFGAAIALLATYRISRRSHEANLQRLGARGLAAAQPEGER
jgi:GPH family glycoside/pentoside/hexuronide:cation symporter